MLPSGKERLALSRGSHFGQSLGSQFAPVPTTPYHLPPSASLVHTTGLVPVGTRVCSTSDNWGKCVPSNIFTNSVEKSHPQLKFLRRGWIRSLMGEADSQSQVNEPLALERIYKYTPEGP